MTKRHDLHAVSGTAHLKRGISSHLALLLVRLAGMGSRTGKGGLQSVSCLVSRCQGSLQHSTAQCLPLICS